MDRGVGTMYWVRHGGGRLRLVREFGETSNVGLNVIRPQF